MSKFAGTRVRPNVTAPVRSTFPMDTHEGGKGYARDPKSELFLLAVSNLVKEQTFYESGKDRDNRFATLIHLITQDDPEWIARFVPYLRDELHMRSASLVMAAEYVKAKGPNGRQVVSAALKRADEPAEMLAYWHQEHGRRLPAAIKRGIADAVVRGFNEFSALKYDGKGRAWRMGDVIDLVHPKPQDNRQSALFRYLLDTRHNRDNPVPEELRIIREVQEWDGSLPLPSGVTWERLSSYRKMDKEAWEAVIPQMGYMALLRNLRNFDEAGVSEDVYVQVARKLADPDEVAKSKQFPIRFLSAYKQLESLRWGHTLELALDSSLVNVPALSGKTLVMVDVSHSMFHQLSERSRVQAWEVAAIFGAALAMRAENATLVAYGDDGEEIKFAPRGSVLKAAEKCGQSSVAQGGTRTMDVLRTWARFYDRVVILTDEQAFESGADVSGIPLIYTFNIDGYRPGHLPSGEKGRYTFGGLTDAGFTAIAALEKMQDGSWPF